MQPATPAPRTGTSASLVTGGFAVLAFAALLAVLSLSSAELENPPQATLWATAAFAVGLLGAVAAIVGAVMRARR